jgi:hypothetical protein
MNSEVSPALTAASFDKSRALTFDSNDLQGHLVVEFYHRRLGLGNGL